MVGGSKLLPLDLTVAVGATRVASVRARWRQLDYVGQLDARIAEPRLRQAATIAMVSPKGGVGKTTVTALLGTLFSLLRRDPIVAVDTNPDFGLLVVPAPTDPRRMATLDEEAYTSVITRLKDFFSLILLDCGTGLQDPASAAATAAADQVVLITDAQPATASLVAQSADLLSEAGRPIVVVVNRMPAKGSQLDLERLSQHVPAARGLVVIPDHVPAATELAGAGFDWRDAPDSWQTALRELAVVLVSDWHRLGLA